MQDTSPNTADTQPSLLVIAPNDLSWAAVRLLLQSMPDVEILGDASQEEEALQADARRVPSAIISCPTLSGRPTLPLLQRLQSRWPETKLIILVDKRLRSEFETYANLPATSCLCWSDLTPQVLQHSLLAALHGSLRVFSASVADGVVTAPPGTPGKDGQAPALPARTHAILHGLAEGLSQQQVASREDISLRTVQRTVAELQARLGTPTLFALGCEVARLGLLVRGTCEPSHPK